MNKLNSAYIAGILTCIISIFSITNFTFAADQTNIMEVELTPEQSRTTGKLTSIEMINHPWFIITLNLSATGQDKRFVINIAGANISEDDFAALQQVETTIIYSSDKKYMLLDIETEGKTTKFRTKSDDNDTIAVKGIIHASKAMMVNNPDKTVAIELENGKLISFNYPLEDRFIVFDGKSVTAHYEDWSSDTVRAIQPVAK